MNLHPDVLRDLLPLYLAGEASPATRALVEQALAADPELARLAAAARAEEPLTASAELPRPAPEAAKRALDATRRLLRRRTWFFASAIFTTLLPLSIAIGDDGISYFLIRDAPLWGALCWVAAAALWSVYAMLSRRLQVTGL